MCALTFDADQVADGEQRVQLSILSGDEAPNNSEQEINHARNGCLMHIVGRRVYALF